MRTDLGEARVDSVVAELADARALAVTAQRPDLVERLDGAERRLRTGDATVAVVGEFKQGKSTLVNALLRTDICPVDADLVTAVPTFPRYARPPSAYLQIAMPDGEIAATPVDFGQLRRHITESGGDPAPRGVEVRLDRRLLGAG